MKAKNILTVLLLLAVCAGTCTICSCSKDDTEENGPSGNGGGNNNNGQQNQEIVVTIDANGNADGGHYFTAPDAKTFFVDYIKYSIKEGHLAVSGYDETGLKSINGKATIVSKIIYKGVPYAVLEIEEDAIKNCKILTSITIGYGVTSISDGAFEDCTSLISVTIPEGITSIDSEAFYKCTGLTSVHITDLASWCKISFDGKSSNPLYYAHHLYLNGKEVKDLVIPDGVTSIGKDAFYGCSSLTFVTISNSVTSIGSDAFNGCTSLTSITIPNSVTSIGINAFYGCTSLTSVTIGNSVTSIGRSAFYNCTSLTNVYCHATTPPNNNYSN